MNRFSSLRTSLQGKRVQSRIMKLIAVPSKARKRPVKNTPAQAAARESVALRRKAGLPLKVSDRERLQQVQQLGDKAPHKSKALAKRLVRETVEHREAAAPRYDGSVGLSVEKQRGETCRMSVSLPMADWRVLLRIVETCQERGVPLSEVPTLLLQSKIYRSDAIKAEARAAELTEHIANSGHS